MDSAEFVVRLIDKATGPAKRISSAFAGIEKSLKPVKDSKAFKALDKAGDKLFEFGKAAVIAGGLLAVGLSAALTKASLDAAMFKQDTTLAFTQLTHSAAQGEEAFDTVRGLVGDLGLDLHDTTDQFRKLLAAQFSIKESEELVKMAADLSAIGIHGEESARVLTAISQIKAKGKVQQEELLQLAEAGVSLELILGQLQKATGKSRDELMKLQQAGKITSDTGLAAIEAAVKEKLGIQEFGEARAEFVKTNLSGMIQAMKAQGDLLFLKLGESILGAVEAMGPLLDSTKEWIANLDTSGVTVVVERILDAFVKLLPLVQEFASGFLSGFGDLAAGFSMDIDATSLQSAAEAGRQVAAAMGTILSVARMVGDVILWLTTSPVGKFVASLGIFLIVGAKIISFISAMSAAWGVVAAAMAPVAAFFTGTLIPILTYLGGILVAFVASVGAIPILIAAAFVAAGIAIYVWWDEIMAFFSGIAPWMMDLGGAMMRALGDGIMAGVTWIVEAATNAANSAIQAVKDAIGMHSPPAEFVDIGVASGEAIGMGFEKSSSSIQSASANALAAPAIGGASGGVAMGGGGGPTVNVYIQVDGAGDPRGVGEEVFLAFEAKMALMFERFNSPSPAPAAA